MATVIDSLVVEFGLDTSKFTQGQKDTLAALKKMVDQSTSTAKEMQAGGKKAGEFFGGIKTQVIGLLGVFTAGAGIKSFVQSIVGTDAAVGRMAKNVGMSAGQFSAWQSVAERSGGSAGGMAGSIANLSNQMQQLALTGQSSIIPFLNAAHVDLQKFFDTATPMSEKLLELSDAFAGMDPAKAQALGAGMGLDAGTINVLMQGRDAVRALLVEQERIGHVNDADAAAAQRLQSVWTALGQHSTDLGRKLLTEAAPYLEMMAHALQGLSEWAAAHRPMVEAAFYGLAAAAVAFAAVLAAPAAGMAALAAGIGVAIAAIAVLYDDWKTWIDGGQSAFGGFWQFFADKWNSVSGIVTPIFASLKAVAVDALNGIIDAVKLVTAVFTGNSDDIRNAWHGMVVDLGQSLTDFVGLVKNLGPALLDAFKSAFGVAFDYAKGRAKALWNAVTFRHDDVPDGPPVPEAAPAAQAPGGGSWMSRLAAKVGLGGSSAAPLTADQHASAAADIAQLMGLGWSKDQATGIAANIQRESAGNGAATGDNGQAYGLAQWHPDRQAAFAKWAGKDIRQSTHAEQVAFINEEMRNGSERGAGAALSRATNAADAAAIVSARYERPADRDGEAQKRAQIALALSGGAQPDPSLVTGAGAQVASSRAANSNSVSNSSNQVNIASVTVQTQATDATGVAKGIKSAVQSQFAAQANFGLM